MIGHLVLGFSSLGSFSVLLLLLVGMTVGIFVGMLPGLGVVLVLTLMLPFIYHMSVLDTVALMLATQSGSYFSASITAILLNTPGAPESFPTTFDGFPMAMRGEAGKALAISATSTWMGGWIACIAFVGLIQLAGPIATVFRPPEFIAVIILAIVLIAQSENIPTSKILISGSIGLMLSEVGIDPVTGVERFTLGLTGLYNGIGVVPFALGLFAITQMIMMYGTGKSVATINQAKLGKDFHSQVKSGIIEAFRGWYHVARSAIVAVVLGLVPGIGGFTSNFIAYGLGKSVSKNRSKFGSGIPEGLMSAEGSSLAKEVASLIPAVSLGLPSGLGMVIFIAALTILGLEPGPALLKTSPTLPYAMMGVMAIAGLLSCVLGLLLAPQLARVTTIKGPFLFPFIIALAILGSYADATSRTGIYLLVVFGIIGVIIRKLHYSVASAAIGLVLGSIFDDNVHLTSQLYGWSFLIKAPLADILFLVTIIILVSGIRRSLKDKVTKGKNLANADLLEWLFDVGLVLFSIVYVKVGMGYPSQASQIPVVLGTVAATAGTYRFVIDLRAWLSRKRQEMSEGTLELSDVSTGDNEEPFAAQLGGLATKVAIAQKSSKKVIGESQKQSHHQNLRQLFALGWFLGFVLSALVLGFEIGIPLLALLYALANRDIESLKKRSVFAISTAIVTGMFAFAFVHLFHLTFQGMI